MQNDLSFGTAAYAELVRLWYKQHSLTVAVRIQEGDEKFDRRRKPGLRGMQTNNP